MIDPPPAPLLSDWPVVEEHDDEEEQHDDAPESQVRFIPRRRRRPAPSSEQAAESNTSSVCEIINVKDHDASDGSDEVPEPLVVSVDIHPDPSGVQTNTDLQHNEDTIDSKVAADSQHKAKDALRSKPTPTLGYHIKCASKGEVDRSCTEVLPLKSSTASKSIGTYGALLTSEGIAKLRQTRNY